MRPPSSAIDPASVHAAGATGRWAAILLLMVAADLVYILCRQSVRHRISRLQADDGREARERLRGAGLAVAERRTALLATAAALALLTIVGWLLLHPDRIPI
jgi:hypothetical protein